MMETQPNLRRCIRGHDRNVVGVSKNGWCRECDRLRQGQRYRERAQHDPRARIYSVELTSLISVRKREGFTQRQIADESGYSESFIADLEHGRRKATREVQGRILDALVTLKATKRERLARLARAGL